MGGKKSSGVDKAYNRRMAKVAEQQQQMAQEYFDFWKSDYAPMEQEQIAANRSLIPVETANARAKLQAETGLVGERAGLESAQIDSALALLPGQTALTKAQTDAALSLLPGKTELAQARITEGMGDVARRTGAKTALYNEVMKGPDIAGEMNMAGSETAAGYKGAAQKTAADASRLGLGGMVSRMANTNLGLGSSVAAARTAARRGAKAQYKEDLRYVGGLGG